MILVEDQRFTGLGSQAPSYAQEVAMHSQDCNACVFLQSTAVQRASADKRGFKSRFEELLSWLYRYKCVKHLRRALDDWISFGGVSTH